MKLNNIHIEYTLDGEYRSVNIKESCTADDATFSVCLSDERFVVNIDISREICLHEVRAEFEYDYPADCRLFFNGYQSWTDSKEQLKDGRMYRLNRFPKFLVKKHTLREYGDINFVRYGKKKGQMHGISYAYVRVGQNYTLFGSLAEQKGFTVIRSDTNTNSLSFERDCDGYHFTGSFTLLDVAILRGDENTVFDGWFSLMGIEKPRGKRISGYTSWYNHYNRINEQIINDDLQAFKKAGIKPDVFQIDDGWQTKIGDWLSVDKEKFPRGIDPIAEKISDEGILPGLWLAPFAAAVDSSLAKNHPDWLLKKEDGNPLLTGSNWGGFYSLDIYNDEVRDYLRNVFDTVINKWGFGLVKLDFLYAACMLPRYDKTRGEVMHDAMRFLREICGDAFILGCGMPLASGFGLVDYCRIGCDVSLIWDDVFYAKYMHRERISTKVTLLDTIYRRQLDKRAFRNDPDVFLLRRNNIKLSDGQKEKLATINALFGGVLFTSDNVAEYDAEQRKIYDGIHKLDIKNFISADTDGHVTTVRYMQDGEEKQIKIIE